MRSFRTSPIPSTTTRCTLAVDGTTRTYPGTDKYPCKDFDPRVRTWYLQSLYVKKVVTVVIDIGFSMGDPLTSGDDASQNPEFCGHLVARRRRCKSTCKDNLGGCNTSRVSSLEREVGSQRLQGALRAAYRHGRQRHV